METTRIFHREQTLLPQRCRPDFFADPTQTRNDPGFGLRTGELYAPDRPAGAGVGRGWFRSFSSNARAGCEADREGTAAQCLLHARERSILALQTRLLRCSHVLRRIAIIP